MVKWIRTRRLAIKNTLDKEGELREHVQRCVQRLQSAQGLEKEREREGEGERKRDRPSERDL